MARVSKGIEQIQRSLHVQKINEKLLESSQRGYL